MAEAEITKVQHCDTILLCLVSKENCNCCNTNLDRAITVTLLFFEYLTLSTCAGK